MKRVSVAYKKVLLPACLIFTLICFAFSILLGSSEKNADIMTINTSNLTQIFLFSVILSAGNLVFGCKKLKFALALLLHFIITIADVSIVFFLIGGHFTTMSNCIAVLIVFAVVYVIIAVFSIILRKLFSRSVTKDSEKEYTRRF